jgi:16S rRNA (cytosine1402-N4)-methyltransferase
VSDEYHVPVLVSEVLSYLDVGRGGLFFDGTVGGGGHSEAILRADAGTRVLGVDRDPAAVAAARARLARFGERVELELGDYADVAERLAEALAGALLDLGVSSTQLEEAGRGFSFREGTPLDMRMGRSGRTAAELLNTENEEALADVFYLYGEERRSRKLAAEVIRRRKRQPFETSDDVIAVLGHALGRRPGMKDRARIFQALRIAVNDELASLDRALPALRDDLAPAGVLVVIAYHSLEDRRVKLAFREWSQACTCPPALPVCVCGAVAAGETLTRRVVVPSAQEQDRNRRSRSAKLRAWRKAA